MKKILLTMAFVLTALGNAWADDVTVSDITIPQGSVATLEISLTNEANQFLQLFQLFLRLPEGVTVVPNSAELNRERFNQIALLETSNPNPGEYRFVCTAGTDKTPISGTSGAIMTVQLRAATTATGLTGELVNMEITDNTTTKFNPTDKTFNITIGAPLGTVTLDENDTSKPASSGGVAKDVTVLRTINANEWSTICLPFDMTGAQVVSAFGDDVKIADLTSWSFEGDATSATSISVTFTSLNPADGLMANHPYMIKVTSSVSQFTAYNVVIDPANSPSKLIYYSVTTGEGRDEITTTYNCYMYGYYYKQKLYKGDFFISENKFWQCDGNSSTIKGFRGDFYFKNITLAEGASSRVMMNFNDEPTRIGAVNVGDDSSDEYYNLQGQRVDTPAKGVFIKGGKKIFVK